MCVDFSALPLFAKDTVIPIVSLLAGLVMLYKGGKVIATRFTALSRVSVAKGEVKGILEAYVAGYPKSANVESTLYRPDRRKKKLEQVIPNYPSGTYSEFKHGLDVSKGIIGLCYRTEGIAIGTVAEDNFERDTIYNWAFTRKEVKKLNHDIRSYLALPIKDMNETVAGVLFLQSTEEHFFDKEDNRKHIEPACPLIARYLKP